MPITSKMLFILTARRCYTGCGHDSWWVRAHVLPAPSWPWGFTAGHQGCQCQGQHQEYHIRWLQDPHGWPCERWGYLLWGSAHCYLSLMLCPSMGTYLKGVAKKSISNFPYGTFPALYLQSYQCYECCCNKYLYTSIMQSMFVSFTGTTMFDPSYFSFPSDCPQHEHAEDGKIWQNDL